jgi:DNA-binding transcriptional LysR family regulator
MELRHLRYFVAVAEEEHVGRAARRLHIAQSALSKQIQDLEREVGAQLFERLPRGIRLSEAGRLFLGHARDTLAGADAGLRAVRAATAGDAGTVRLGTPDWGNRTQLVANAIGLFKERRPGAVVEFDATPWTLHPAALRDRKIDIGFGLAGSASDFPPELEAEQLIPEPARSAVLPATHPLASNDTVSLASLADLPFVYFDREIFPPLYDAVFATLRDAGYRSSQLSASMPSFAAAAQLVASGAGWTYVVDSVAAVPPPGTVVRPITDVMRALGFFALRRRDDQSVLTPALLDCLRESATLFASDRFHPIGSDDSGRT